MSDSPRRGGWQLTEAGRRFVAEHAGPLSAEQVATLAMSHIDTRLLRPEIRAFYGALAGQRAKKGVFITTSGYTAQALQFAQSVEGIVLVDGVRLKGAEGIARVFFCTLVGRRIVMLHSFVKKTQKTPPQQIDIARKRMKDIKHANP